MRKSYMRGSIAALMASMGAPRLPNPYPEADKENHAEFELGFVETDADLKALEKLDADRNEIPQLPQS